jgi:hypothetical protein
MKSRKALEELPRGATPTATLLSVFALIFSWQLTAALFVGRWLFGPGWLGPHRELVTLGVSTVLSIYYAVWGRARMEQYKRATQGSQQTMTWGQAGLVVMLVVFRGVFGTWLFVRI